MTKYDSPRGHSGTFYVLDEKTLWPTKDTKETIQADLAIVERVSDRLKNRDLTTGGRLWVGKDEIKTLRRLAGMGFSNKHIGPLKNRRLRIATVQQFLTRAEDNLAARAAALVSDHLVPTVKPIGNKAFAESLNLKYQQLYGTKLAKTWNAGIILANVS